MRLYYFYAKSSKKQRIAKSIQCFEGKFEMYSAGIHPVNATGMCWIDHKIHAVGRVVEKFGLYNQRL